MIKATARGNEDNMWEQQLAIQKSNGHGLSQRTQRLIEGLDELWQHPCEPTSEQVKRITEFVVHFPEPYQALAMKEIAEHLVNNMGLHYLDLMSTFQQKAEQEGIDQEEREGTFHDTMAELLPAIMGLSRNISIRSLDDLVTLGNITFGLYRLSQVDSAERAQRWMYKLPKLYRSQLAQEHLLQNAPNHLTVTIHSATMHTPVGQPELKVTVYPAAARFVGGEPQITVTIGSPATKFVDSTASPGTTLVA
jgi:hypothetical protein